VIRFDGDRLELNYATSAAGSIRVEVQDAAGNVLGGLSLDRCEEIIGDEIARVVRWKGTPSLAALAGKPVRLRFVMADADLFSFRFRLGDDSRR
jgi:hypothetical protein